MENEWDADERTATNIAKAELERAVQEAIERECSKYNLTLKEFAQVVKAAEKKAAAVELVDIEFVDDGICTVKVLGEVADVLTAVESGSSAAQRVGQLRHRHVIAQPADDTEKLIFGKPVWDPVLDNYDALSDAVQDERKKQDKARKGRRKK